MQLRYSFRLYPSPGQQQAVARAFGCARVVFNDALAACRDAHAAGRPYPTDAELSARLTASKATPQRAWLGEVSSVVLQQALADLNAAYRNFFASLNGDRKGRKAGLPRFRSFVVQVGHDPLPEVAAETGIDLGLAHFAVLPDGRKIASPKFLRRAERKLRKAQKCLSRKARGSSNRNKARARVARVHAKVADSRRDWLHKESTRIIRENQAVYVEDTAGTDSL
ncbi:MAG TPA: transposase [Streptosporangiaceae bacterium]|nr:transposase [Streptosporangiaceae bacterium]